jgi:hypothetical protein
MSTIGAQEEPGFWKVIATVPVRLVPEITETFPGSLSEPGPALGT